MQPGLKTKNPTTSVMVVIKTLEATAGSILLLSKRIDIVVPANPAMAILVTIAIAITPPNREFPNQAHATPPASRAKMYPFRLPTINSLIITCPTFVVVI